MTEIETMVQRFIDQELSPAERVRFVVRLGRDAALRDRVLALEEVVADAGRLPRPLVPEGFAQEVLRRSASTPIPPPASVPTAASIWRRTAEVLWAPRNLRWNLAGAATALGVAGAVMTTALLAMLSLSSIGSDSASGASASAREPQRSAGASASPTDVAAATPASTSTSAPLVLVRLVVLQPKATSVAVAGDFNGWTPARTPLERMSGDAWTVTLPLEPGRYEYMLVVDGHRWMADPLASEHSDDGFGSRNAVLDVRPAVDPL